MARQLGASVAVNLQAMPLTVIKTMPTPVKKGYRVECIFEIFFYTAAMSNCISYRAASASLEMVSYSAKAYYGLTLSIINCNVAALKRLLHYI